MKKFRPLAAIAAISAAALVLTGCASDSAEETESYGELGVQFSWIKNAEFAGKFGHFPGPDDSAMIVAVAEHPVPEVDDGFLWNAVPAKSCQYLDLEAVCADETSSGSSACGDSEGELTPGFVDDLEAEKENLSTDDALLLQRFFPHTAKYVDPMTLI